MCRHVYRPSPHHHSTHQNKIARFHSGLRLSGSTHFKADLLSIRLAHCQFAADLGVRARPKKNWRGNAHKSISISSAFRTCFEGWTVGLDGLDGQTLRHLPDRIVLQGPRIARQDDRVRRTPYFALPLTDDLALDLVNHLGRGDHQGIEEG